MKVAIYNRTSTEEQHPENQLKDCISINEYGDYEIFQDKQSAWKDNLEREEFEKILKLVKSKKIQHLIVWDLDRLYRNRKRLIEFFELCKAYGCLVHSFRQKWLEDLSNIPSPWNEIMFNLMLQIMGWLAEDESNKKSDRVKISVRRKEGIAYSYKGNKWGRKGLSTQKKNQINEIYLKDKNKPIRAISEELGISKSVVHKYLNEIKQKKSIK